MYVGKVEEILETPSFKKLAGKVDLILTSPPFPLNTKKRYGNKTGTEYVQWLRLRRLASQLSCLQPAL